MAKVKIDLSEELPSNSRMNKAVTTRPEPGTEKAQVRPKPARVISGRAIKKKAGLAQGIARALINPQTRGLGGYILDEVIIPTAKTMIEDIFKNALDRVLYGDDGRPSRSRETGSKVSYGSYYKDRQEKDSRIHRSPKDKFGLQDIFFSDAKEPGEVLDAMCEQLEEYEVVTVADFFDMAGLEGATWAHHNWGWTDLSKARAIHTRYGWTINLPEPEELPK